MQLLQTIKERFTEREQQRGLSAEQVYRQVIERIADGAEPSVEEVEAALASGERTIDQLEADVTLLKQRRVWAEHLADAERARQDERELQKREQAEQDRWKKLHEEHRQRTAQLTAERQGIEHRMTLGRTAHNQLTLTCNDPLLQKKHAQLTEQLQPITAQLNQLRQTELGRHFDGLSAPELERRARLQSRASELQAALVQLDAETLIP